MISEDLPRWLKSVHRDGSDKYVSDPYPQLGDTVRIRLRASIAAPINEAYLRTFPDGEQALSRLEAGVAEETCQWWEVNLKISAPVVHYRFLILAQDGLWS